MLFPTVGFALFFTAVMGIFWLLRAWGRGWAWKLFLIGASYFFYGYWDSRFLLLLAALTAGNFLFGQAIAASRRTVDGAPPPADDGDDNGAAADGRGGCGRWRCLRSRAAAGRGRRWASGRGRCAGLRIRSRAGSRRSLWQERRRRH